MKAFALSLAFLLLCNTVSLAQCRCGPGCKCPPGVCAVGACHTISLDDHNYAAMSAQALKDNKVLVVGVGCEPIVPMGFLGCRCDSIGGKTGCWVSVPHAGELRANYVPETASVQQVRDEVERVKDALKPRPSYVPQYQPTYQQSYQPRYVQSRSC